MAAFSLSSFLPAITTLQPSCREPASDGKADAAATAGHDGRLAFEEAEWR